ncbi:hypothetical protein [Meiothermus sp.]|uniref:hypothetical protein n=1 Tax=Meiothermus sp. TaxID=1955249 RepID=UPI00307DCDE9
MANNNTTQSAADLPTVEHLAEQYGIPAWTLAGVRVREGWAVGARLKETEFTQAVERFLKSPTDGPLPARKRGDA